MAGSRKPEAMTRTIEELEKRLAEYEKRESGHDLREVTNRLEKIAEMGDDGIIVFGEDSRIEFANQMAADIFDISKEDILGSEFYRLIGKSDQAFLTDILTRGRGVGQKVCAEMAIRTHRGDMKETEVCIAPTKTEDGKSRTYAYIRDITERKKYEKDLKESEEKYRNLFERVRHGLYISAKEGRFLDCNQEVLDMLCYDSKEEFLQIDIAKDLYIRPEDRVSFQKLIEKQGFVKDFEVQFKKKDKEEITVLLTAHVKKDEKGVVVGYEGLIIDISERKRMEKELREANEFLTKLIESSVDGIIVSDTEGKVLIFNAGAENILGYKTDEVVGKINIRSIYPPGVAKEVMQKLRSREFGGVGKLSSFPLLFRRKDGELIECDLSASLIYDEEGTEIVSVGIFKDLRERLGIERELIHTREALLQAEKLAAMGRLTSQIAHELNNPIYGIMNTLELLKTEVPPESKRRRILELSLSETVRLSEMLRSMLSFSKPEEEKRIPTKINELIEGILLIMEKQMREANVRVMTAFQKDLPEIMASTNQIRQVMLNMIKNAKESMPSGGALNIRTMGNVENVTIIVRDTGAGIPEEIRDKIFDAFFTTKQKVKGVGL
ncbi:MAG: PAS domain S-box protein, partial [Syntrophales bacterium]|nr:PAS domain S-box protein [Syntrophales bacterium]